MVTAPKISNLPAAPNRQQPASFTPKSDALLSALPGFVSETNAVADYVEGAAGQVAIDKAAVDANVPLLNDAKAAAPLSLGYRDAAKAHKDSAAASEALARQHKEDAASAVVYQDLASIALTKGIEMVSGYIDTSPNPPLSVQMANSLWNEPLNTVTRGGRKELPSKRVWICTANGIYMFDGDDPALPLWRDFSLGLPSRGTTKFGWIKACNGKVWVADTVGYPAILHLDFTNDVWSWEGGGQGGGGTGQFTGRIYNRLLTNGDRVRDTARSGTLYIPSFYPLTGAISTRETLCADIRVYPWAEIDPRSGLPIPTLAFGTINGLVFVNGPAGAGTVVTLAHALYTIIRSVCLREDGSVMYAADNGNSGRFLVVQPEIPFDNEVRGNPFGDEVFFHSVPGAVYASQAGTVIDGAANIVMDGAIANNYGLTLLNLNHQEPSESLTAFIKAYSSTGWMNKGTRMALMGTTVQGALDSVNRCSDPTASTTTGRNASSVDWKTAPNSDVNTTTVGKIHFDGSGTGYTKALSSVLIPKGVGGIVRWKQTGFSGTSDSGLRVHACNESGFNLHTVETATSASGSYFPSADGTYEAYIPSGMIEQDYTFQFYKHSFDSAFDIDSIEFIPVIGDLSQNLRYATIRGVVQQVQVADGAELTALEFGGNNANYLEFEDASFLDVGLGDFSFSSWYYSNVEQGSTQYLLFADLGGSNYIQCYRGSLGGPVSFTIRGNTGDIGAVSSPTGVNVQTWVLINAVRKDGVLKLYINGRKVAEDATAAADVSGQVTNAFIGQRSSLDRPFWGKISEWRFSEEALTDEEITTMYKDEAPMFNPDTAVSIAGGKSYVAAATDDRAQGTISTGTDESRSTFKRLIRVSENMEKVGTAIVAHDGMILED